TRAGATGGVPQVIARGVAGGPAPTWAHPQHEHEASHSWSQTMYAVHTLYLLHTLLLVRESVTTWHVAVSEDAEPHQEWSRDVRSIDRSPYTQVASLSYGRANVRRHSLRSMMIR